ncbi:MAG: DUF378 domain-containing protein [Defluviitaleaceae bacterium]|nr:DUF378 domain-containing protein [Defluviitaleaceae bacterium]MCL2276225.1 DUF378 domain-containing protein [Defluviitaleaceae bacterium]
MRYRTWDWVALSLVILGAINWGLIGLFRFDLIAVIFGGMESVMSRIIYVIIALAGLYCLSFIGRTRDIVDTAEHRRPHHSHHNAV